MRTEPFYWYVVFKNLYLDERVRLSWSISELIRLTSRFLVDFAR